MASVENARNGNVVWHAARFRLGLTIALLATRAFRRGELIAMRIGVHVRIRDGQAMIYLPGPDRKNRKSHSVPWPPDLLSGLNMYVSKYRPILLGGRSSDRLWITHMGTPLTEDGLYGEITKVTKRTLGIAVNPHAFRDCVTTSLVLANSANVTHAAALLGHSDTTPTNRYYNQAPAQAAYDHYQAVLKTLMKSEDD